MQISVIRIIFKINANLFNFNQTMQKNIFSRILIIKNFQCSIIIQAKWSIVARSFMVSKFMGKYQIENYVSPQYLRV